MLSADDYIASQRKRIAELEAALADAYPFVCIAVDRYRLEYGLEKLHEKHAEIADRIARLTGHTRMPSKYLVTPSRTQTWSLNADDI